MARREFERMGVEFVANERRILLPADGIDQIIEYDIAPLPLARDCVAGVGVYGDDVVVSLRVGREPAGAARRRATAALFVGAPGGVRWAFEVSRVLSMLRVRDRREGHERIEGDEAGWFAEVTTDDGRSLPWLETERVLADLGATQRRP